MKSVFVLAIILLAGCDTRPRCGDAFEEEFEDFAACEAQYPDCWLSIRQIEQHAVERIACKNGITGVEDGLSLEPKPFWEQVLGD
jgi:hypothetical protein